MLRVSDLRMRDVINISDGRRLGLLKDIDIDLELGRIKSLIVPNQNSRFWGLFSPKSDDIVIPWDKIKKIGVDVILVDATTYFEAKQRED